LLFKRNLYRYTKAVAPRPLPPLQAKEVNEAVLVGLYTFAFSGPIA
jgi:hypothetical protein